MWTFLTERTEDTEEKMRNKNSVNSVGSVRECGMSETLPKNWQNVPLGNIAQYINGRAFKPHEWETSGLPIIRIQNLTKSTDTVNYTSKEHEEKYFVKDGDILMAWSATLDVFVWDDGPAWLNQHIFNVKELSIVDRKFLFYALKRAISEFYSKTHGTGMVHVTKPIFEAHEIPFPPLNEQKRIVAKLDAIIPRIDSVKARLDKVPTLIKRFRQSVLTAAVTGKLTEKWREAHPEVESAEVLVTINNFEINHNFKVVGEIPKKWCWCALGNYAQLSRGRFSIRPRNDPRYYNGDYPFIQIGDLPREGGYVNEHKQTLNEKGVKVSKAFEKNTIAIAIVGATIGNTGILSYKMCFPDSLIGVVTKTKNTSIFTEYYLRTEKENIRNISYSSGGQPNIKLPTLTDYPFPLPPLEEQKEIVRQVDKLFALADRLETHYQNAKCRIDKLSQSVLAKAFRGELVPQDPNDEPAEKLLERIMEEKARLSRSTQRPRRKKN